MPKLSDNQVGDRLHGSRWHRRDCLHWSRWHERLSGGMAGILVDLFSIYKCPTTNITAANTIVNRALAN
jgi:hypothetical protein